MLERARSRHALTCHWHLQNCSGWPAAASFSSAAPHGYARRTPRKDLQLLQLFGTGESSGAAGCAAAWHPAPVGPARRAACRCALWSARWCSVTTRTRQREAPRPTSASRCPSKTAQSAPTYVHIYPGCHSGAAGDIYIHAGGQQYSVPKCAWVPDGRDPIYLGDRRREAAMAGAILAMAAQHRKREAVLRFLVTSVVEDSRAPAPRAQSRLASKPFTQASCGIDARGMPSQHSV